mmetsp:Transcript_8804/g.10530  ORF Transcript_8804/g.10530 Transcript_8804/m.10530 type:complete len:227 (+) Transcript_8804:197-877(+)|eukprot:CAMPEP_0184035162 /NCGR_PEP_ID=MMETSP0955-20130417/23920_1 /TAXON_ID=627963 /ORGANISM="Aplanochytrium sp, Strain PBS07" /LENGTH=226 /DNA_ID=CAMNT_0026322207 /DNA_START=86 /DNA_END=766 /DNA_ORIENTATION=-
MNARVDSALKQWESAVSQALTKNSGSKRKATDFSETETGAARNPSTIPANKKPNNLRPWEYDGFLNRLGTFSSSTWFGKVEIVSAKQCALRGWVNVRWNCLRCPVCKVELDWDSVVASTKKEKDQDRKQRAEDLQSVLQSLSNDDESTQAKVFRKLTASAHSKFCPWHELSDIVFAPILEKHEKQQGSTASEADTSNNLASDESKESSARKNFDSVSEYLNRAVGV